jgi:hypothetical protein
MDPHPGGAKCADLFQQAGAPGLPFQHLVTRNTELSEALAEIRKDLAAEQAATAILRKALAELSLELQEAREELTALGNVTRLDSRRLAGPQGER